MICSQARRLALTRLATHTPLRPHAGEIREAPAHIPNAHAGFDDRTGDRRTRGVSESGGGLALVFVDISVVSLFPGSPPKLNHFKLL